MEYSPKNHYSTFAHFSAKCPKFSIIFEDNRSIYMCFSPFQPGPEKDAPDGALMGGHLEHLRGICTPRTCAVVFVFVLLSVQTNLFHAFWELFVGGRGQEDLLASLDNTPGCTSRGTSSYSFTTFWNDLITPPQDGEDSLEEDHCSAQLWMAELANRLVII